MLHMSGGRTSSACSPKVNTPELCALRLTSAAALFRSATGRSPALSAEMTTQKEP